jgi:CRISPR-associated protein Csx17
VTAERQGLRAIPISGLSPDSLGNYLASLGLLRLLSRKWPSVRVAWHDDILDVLGGPPALGDLLDELILVATNRSWTAYERGWAAAQKKSTKAESGQALALWQASAEEAELEMLASHAVPASRVSFNPLLGTGGNAGKRVFSEGWKQAVEALAPPAPKKSGKNETVAKKAAREEADQKNADDEARRKRAELERVLLGKPTAWLLEKLNAASWFSEANKLYNSGQGPYREGRLSPWSMALACEGLTFFAGGASRRLGARARAVGAFPFVTRSAAPEVVGEAGRNLGEVWAPVWERPMTIPEVRALFARGRAELRGRGVLTPSAFATAIMRRGVDAGISEFRRFTLGRTTSANTFEPRFEGTFRLPAFDDVRPSSTRLEASGTVVATALERVTALIEQPRFPRDRKIGKRWRVVGLRGPIESAALRVAAAPDDPEAALAMMDTVVESLDRVDRSFRDSRVSWEPLPIEWLPSLFADEPPEAEARLALALVSAFPLSRPLTLYRFGVEWNFGRFEHAERAPARWVWGPGDLPRVLSVVLARRTLDWETTRKEQRREEEPVRVVMPATCLHVGRWLDGDVDERLLAMWISRLALFDWRTVPHTVRALAQPSPDWSGADGALCLFGLFQPLFDLHPLLVRGVSSRRDLLDPKSGARTPAAARALVGLLRAGNIDAAVRLASSRYAMAGTVLARTSSPWSVGEPERLLASILFPIPDCERAALNERWLRPRRRHGDEAHA